ncbi:MAG: phosphatase PAP2 family protein [bacterium]|nr:phosphatase PAP2 family protein [bacterium]
MDITVFEFLFSFAHRSSLADGFIVFFASWLPILIVFGILFFVFRFSSSWRKRFFLLILLALSAVIARGILTEVIRFLYYRPRPFELLGVSSLFGKESSAFPSGHAALLFALSFIVFFFHRRWGAVFLGLSLLVGVARVIAGVHFPSDILGGIIVALFSSGVVYLLPVDFLHKKTE